MASGGAMAANLKSPPLLSPTPYYVVGGGGAIPQSSMTTASMPMDLADRSPMDRSSYLSNSISSPPAAGGAHQQQQQQLQPQQQVFGSGRPTPAAASYFPQQQSGGLVDVETLSNTLANSNTPDHQQQQHQLIYNRNQAQAAGPGAGRFNEEWDASQRSSSLAADGGAMHRTNSIVSVNAPSMGGSGGGGFDGTSTAPSLSRGNTLRKKPSLRKSGGLTGGVGGGGSLRRSSSRRSMKAGSVRSLALQAGTSASGAGGAANGSDTGEELRNSAFYCPVPTSGNPTEALATRFQTWRKILKDLIAYFREIQTHYEHRAKALVKLVNVLNNTQTPPGFLASGGLDDALQVLRAYHRQAVAEANKAREIEEDVILALTGLRSDLQQKVKEIKNLSGDFKNTVDKEMDATRRAVNALQDVLGQSEHEPASTTGKKDPYLLKLEADRQLEKQIDEENYLHQAYLNLENSGRELESIVVGEIQKSYNAYATILKREADTAYSAVEEMRSGPIAMPKDHEWQSFIGRDDQFVDPDLPIRRADNIHYPGRDHEACQELRAGLLERKSKYLKSYTAGWYVLSPTHLHEFKSADKTGTPVMSLFLPEQKLGSHSAEGSSSNKFILKGRQTGNLHRGHTWVFRAESHETMMAWYEDLQGLTDSKTAQERSDFVRGHVSTATNRNSVSLTRRTNSRASQRPGSSISSDGNADDDDDDDPPFRGGAGGADAMSGAAGGGTNLRGGQQQQQFVVAGQPVPTQQDGGGVVFANGVASVGSAATPRRPPSGGRFPSDLQVNNNGGAGPSRQAVGPESPASSAGTGGGGSSWNADMAAAATLPGAGLPPSTGYGGTARTPLGEAHSSAAAATREARSDGVNPYTSEPIVVPQASFAQHQNQQQHVQMQMQAAAARRGSGYGFPGQDWTPNGAANLRDVSPMSGPGGAVQQPQTQQRGGVVAAGPGTMSAAAAAAIAAARRASSSVASEEDSMSVDSGGGAGGGIGGIAGPRRRPPPPATYSVAGADGMMVVINGVGQDVNGRGVPATAAATRPALNTAGGSAPTSAKTSDSVPTISHLHIPGEFPRSAGGLA